MDQSTNGHSKKGTQLQGDKQQKWKKNVPIESSDMSLNYLGSNALNAFTFYVHFAPMTRDGPTISIYSYS